MIKSVIFDVDGVLIDSVSRSVASLCGIISRHNLEPNYSLIINNWGYSFSDVLIPILAADGAWPDYKVQLVLNDANLYFEEAHFSGPANLKEKLEALKEADCGLGIVTNRSFRMLEKALFDLNVNQELFDHLHSADTGILKPDPRVFEQILKNAGEQVFFIGDSIVCDLPAANQCSPKVDFVGITSIIHSKEDFVAAGVPEHKVHDSVVDFIDELLCV